MRVRGLTAALLVAGALALAPGAAQAAVALPDAIDDPPAALEPELVMPDPRPATPAEDDGVAGAEGADAASAQAFDVPDESIVAFAGSGGVVPAGALPFTGVDGELAVLLGLIGALCVAAGATFWLAGRSEFVR